jgi:hypothetical protein
MLNFRVLHEMERDGDTFTCPHCDRRIEFDGVLWRPVTDGDQDADHHFGIAISAEIGGERWIEDMDSSF